MFPMDRKVLTDQPVVLEYTRYGKRVRKECRNSYEARQEFKRLARTGQDPHVVAKPAAPQ